MALSKNDYLYYILGSFGLGIGIGAVDYYFNQLILITLLLFIPNAVLGYLSPNRAWLNALSCSAGFILIETILGPGLGIAPTRWPLFSFLAAFLTPIPAFIGSYWGAVMRWIKNAADRVRQNKA